MALYKSVLTFNIYIKAVTTSLTSFHLPDVHGAVRAANDDEIVMRSPLDDVYRKQLTWCKQDTLVVTKRQQRQRVITGDGTDAHLHTSLSTTTTFIVNNRCPKYPSITLTYVHKHTLKQQSRAIECQTEKAMPKLDCLRRWTYVLWLIQQLSENCWNHNILVWLLTFVNTAFTVALTFYFYLCLFSLTFVMHLCSTLL